jgi:hypothetical protein
VNPINSAKQANALIDFIGGKLKGELAPIACIRS